MVKAEGEKMGQSIALVFTHSQLGSVSSISNGSLSAELRMILEHRPKSKS